MMLTNEMLFQTVEYSWLNTTARIFHRFKQWILLRIISTKWTKLIVMFIDNNIVLLKENIFRWIFAKSNRTTDKFDGRWLKFMIMNQMSVEIRVFSTCAQVNTVYLFA